MEEDHFVSRVSKRSGKIKILTHLREGMLSSVNYNLWAIAHSLIAQNITNNADYKFYMVY